MFIALDNVPACGPDCKPSCECGHWFEVWNDVFMGYNQVGSNQFEELEQKNVDTGMGVERTIAMLQGKKMVYEIETFTPIIKKIVDKSGKEELNETDEMYVHIIADHVRAAVMIMSDDRQIAPSNVEQGYIVRRLIRKSVFSADQLGIEPGFLPELVEPIIEIYGDIYDEVKRNRDFVIKNLKDEEDKFRKTLNKALRKLDRILNDTGTITGEDAFLLFTSYGLPPEMTREIAEENGIKVDMEDFQKQFEEHREISRTATQGKFKSGLADHSEVVTMMHTATHLLQEALIRVLGDTVQQMGSNITPERLRFDFSFDRKMTQEEVKEIEELVNDAISKDLEVTREIMPYEEAIEKGALAFFKETYEDEVSVYRVGDFSMELCGGPHVESTGVLGKFRIVKQKKIGANVVRVRAILE
jgi:alanyl-tRNA synthetase